MTYRIHHRLALALAYGILAITFSGIGILAIWYAEPAPFVEGAYRRIVLTPVVPQGGVFKLDVKVYWTKECYSRIRRYIVDSTGKINRFVAPEELDPSDAQARVRLNKAGWNHFIIAQQIPQDITPGPAKWRVVTDWFCNPLQYWLPNSQALDDLDFVITERIK